MACCNVWSIARLNFGTTSFQKFLADLFLIHTNTDIANFADDNTPYLSTEKCRRCYISFRWFENNLLKGNADKFHFLVSSSQEVSLNVNNFKI